MTTQDAFTIEVFAETGELRAFDRIPSMPDAARWLDSTPIYRSAEEKLMIRVEDRNHDGFWMYTAPEDAPPDWILGPVARRLRAQIERRRGAKS
jgi:hypothetical protein